MQLTAGIAALGAFASFVLASAASTTPETTTLSTSLPELLAPSPKSAPAQERRQGLGYVESTKTVEAAPGAGEKGGAGLAIKTEKALTVPYEGEQFIDHAVVLVKDGKITAIGPARTTPIPAGYEVVDVGDRWIIPGMIDLHSHVGGTFDINEMVYLTNPGLRVSASVIPHNDTLKTTLASGVTTILYIPGSGVNVGGQGILFKIGLDRFEDAVIRNPGSMKLAQAGNPESWTVGVGRSFMNWNTRAMFDRGMLYAREWEAWEKKKEGPQPERNFDQEIFRWLLRKDTQISTHTQIYQVVLTTLTMVKKELGLDVYIDHGEMAGYRLAGFAKNIGVNAIIGPREVEVPTRAFINWTGSNPEAVLGIAAEYQKAGMKDVGFNTDAPVIPPEELFLQSAMAARYGFDNSNLETLRGLTIVPAKTAGIANRVGSLEAGKDADIVVITGDPSDPRSSVSLVFTNGKRVYDTTRDRRRF